MGWCGVIGSALGPIGTVAGMAIGSALGSAIASGISSIHSDDFYKTLKTIVVDKFNLTLEYVKDNYHYRFSKNELELTCPDGSTNPFAFIDNKATIASSGYGCNKISYISKKTANKFIVDFNKSNIKIESNSDEALKSGVEKAYTQTILNPKTLTLNSQTYNIKQLSNLELRNAIDYIPKVSFLLSNILIKAGETIDLGSKGLYKVKSGDTLSTIAQRNGLITKDLLKLNPH